MLAQRHGGQAQDWILQERPSLPPIVMGHETTTYLSLSHSGDWVACALWDQPVGIDIEQRRPPRDALLRFQHLLLAVGELPDTLSVDELLQRWVAKEAWIKRHHGSALPEHLAALNLQPVTGAEVNVRLISTAAFHFGIAADVQPSGEIEIAADVVASSGWRVNA
ncbi:MAG: hypothetical protein SGI99_14315 [Pseudomonadota bacterium]|nr:hypothetical protein [Pseudomonadota bacterium]